MMPITNALVLAAGLGTRLREGGELLPKPLHRVHGRTLVERTISTLADAGVKRVVVAVGYEADWVKREVRADERLRSRDVEIEFATSWSMNKAHGASLLPAAALIDGPFILSMSDHVYDVSLPRLAIGADMNASDLYLCVDRRIDEVYDIDDANKVVTEDDRIVELAKTLETYNAIDCGVFAASQGLVEELRFLWDSTGDANLSEGVLRLAAKNRAHVLDIGDAFWQDVDTQGALARAESILPS